MTAKIFFDCLKVKIFRGAMSQAQVDGVNAILSACAAEGVTDKRMIAYALATPMIETGGTYVPGVENLNYSEISLLAKFPNRITAREASLYGRNSKHPADQRRIANIIYGGAWGRENLGNVGPNDGWERRGRGLVQITGLRNYTLLGKTIGVDLVENPDLATDLHVAAKIMVVAMRDGLFTGKKFSHYFSPTATDWLNARRIVNKLDKASEIATYARNFHSCLLMAE